MRAKLLKARPEGSSDGFSIVVSLPITKGRLRGKSQAGEKKEIELGDIRKAVGASLGDGTAMPERLLCSAEKKSDDPDQTEALLEPVPPPAHALCSRLLPAGVSPEACLLLTGRGLRAFADGYVAVLLPVYLVTLGFATWKVGVLGTATLLGSALATLCVGAFGHKFSHRRLLLASAILMAATGLGFAVLGGNGGGGPAAFWPLLVVAFVGTLNPSSGDVSVFLPLEHARLAQAAVGDARTQLFARYTLTGSLLAATGALAAGLPDALVRTLGVDRLNAIRGMFVFYGLVGCLVGLLYRRLPVHDNNTENAADEKPKPLGPSRCVVIKLAALFAVDAFAGGLVINALLALWLFTRFQLSIASAGHFFFWAGLLTAASQLAAPHVARRIGLLNTMVFTHIPANLCLIFAALAPTLPIALSLLLSRAALSQMDVPTRAAFVMAVVTPAERAAAASFTAVPRSLAAALSPTLGGALFTAGWLAAPLVACGCLKIAYDLTILLAFRGHRAASNPT